jgi:methyl-accepting chemotaxis protein
MTAVIGEIFKSVEAMISKFEQLIKDGISSMKGIAQDTAGKITQTSTTIFTDARGRMTVVIQTTQRHIEAQKVSTGSIGQNTKTFMSRVETAARDLLKELQAIFDRFKVAMKDLLTDTKSAIEEVKSNLVKKSEDVSGDFDTGIKDFLSELEKVGKNIETGFAKADTSIQHSISVSSSFVHSHDAVLAEGAVLAVVSPVFLIGLIFGGAMIYGGSVYEA